MATLLDIVKKDSTDRSVTIRIIDSTDGTPETGVVFNTAGIDLWYRREGATKTSITEADLTTPALDDAHADGGFLHISDGEYRLDLPDAACATAANHVDVGGTVTGMVVIGGRIRLVDYDPEAALATAAALTTVDTVVDAIKAVTDNLPNSGALSDLATAAALTTVDTVVDAIKAVTDALPDAGALNDLAAILTDTGTTLPATLATIQAVTDALPDAGALNDLAAILTDTGTTLPATLAAILAGTVLVSTSIGSDGRSTTSCRLEDASDNDNAYVGMRVILDDDAGDGEYVSRTITDYAANNKVLTWAPAITEDAEDGGNIYIIPGDTTINVTADAIRAVTDALPDAGALNDLAAILTDTGTTLPATLAAIQAVTDALPDAGALNDLAAILTDTGTTLPATLANLATAAALATVDTVVDAIKAVTDVSLYTARVDLSIDEANSQDEYTIQWFKNGIPVTSGITSPTIQVIKRADGTDLVAEDTPTEIGSTGAYKHDETSGRTTAGQAVVVVVGATIDAAGRTWREPISRDSE